MRRAVFIMVFMLPLLLFAAGRGDSRKEASRNDVPRRERRFEFTYHAAIAHPPRGARRVEMWIPYPKSDAEQEIYDARVVSDFPSRVGYEKEYGNGVLYVAADRPGDKAVEVTLKFKAVRRETKSSDEDGSPPAARFLAADRLVLINDEIKKLAKKITAGKTGDMEKARAIYDYVAHFMTYDKSGVGWGNGDTRFCLMEARGNCTDYHSLFLSLARSVGIPAKFEIGFPLPEEKREGEVAGYHCWAKFFARGRGWVPIDNSEADKHPERSEYFFGGLDENRLMMSVGRDILLTPPQAGNKVNYFVYPYAEADGAPVKDVKVRFSFRDLPPDGKHNVAAAR